MNQKDWLLAMLALQDEQRKLDREHYAKQMELNEKYKALVAKRPKVIVVKEEPNDD